ncbi:Hypothetical protein CINCED_3A019934 [Cinara cedri]|uniref:Uncharacterized protein n=1 Tax=Cinara cedri TaxID=506608 RepID=A0A5E4MNS7_9HEMI|nr:Hypothetical protein CINCED_3A019934 [Cinara cedri]
MHKEIAAKIASGKPSEVLGILISCTEEACTTRQMSEEECGEFMNAFNANILSFPNSSIDVVHYLAGEIGSNIHAVNIDGNIPLHKPISSSCNLEDKSTIESADSVTMLQDSALVLVNNARHKEAPQLANGQGGEIISQVDLMV